MRADKLIQRYSMEKHPEHGLFIEKHYDDESGKRPSSGSIFYYVAPGERTEFHRIDCDEYWCHNAGSSLELWVIDREGRLSRRMCGTDGEAEPFVRFAAGEIFAAKLPAEADDGAFVTCITVPRFTYGGFEIFSREQIAGMCPAADEFWN